MMYSRLSLFTAIKAVRIERPVFTTCIAFSGGNYPSKINSDKGVNEKKTQNASPKQSKTSQFRTGRVLSPMARLKSMLPNDYTAELEYETTKPTGRDRDAEETMSNEDIESRRFFNSGRCKETDISRESTESGRYNITVSFNRGRSVKPSKRLLQRIPKDYWDSIDDEETKSTVESIEKNSDSDAK